MSQPKLSKIETGRATVSVEDVERLAQALDAGSDQTAALADLARSLSTQLRTWRAMRRQDLAGHQQRVRDLEVAARLVRVFQPVLVPGLLQTAEYARQVFLRTGAGTDPAELAAAVAARLERQTMLFDPARRFEFLITEAALRTRICPDAVMAAQVDRITALSSLANVTIGYIPALTEVRVLPLNSFVLFDDRAVLVETISAELVLHDDRDVALYQEAFGLLGATALVGPAALDDLRSLTNV